MTDAAFNQFFDMGRQASESMLKAQGKFIEGGERIMSKQMELARQRLEQGSELMQEWAGVRDLDGFNALMPKSMELAREQLEQAMGFGQELMDLYGELGAELGEAGKATSKS